MRCAAAGNLADDPNQPARPKGPVQRALNRHGIACFTSHNIPGCGSLRSELTFMFGSCRVFFGEPCFGRPPGRPVPEYGDYGNN